MKIYRNTKEIKRRETLGRRFSLTGLGVLFVGLLVSFVPTWYPPDAPIQDGIVGFVQVYWSWISFAALFAGFLCASVGSYYINRYARRRWPGSRLIERPDEVLERNLKGFDDKYGYFAMSLPVGYAVAGPNGVTVFAVRSDKGRVIVNGDQWKEPFSLGRIFTIFAREGVGNPSREIAEQAEKIRALLTAANGQSEPATAVDLTTAPIEGVAVFLNAEIRLELNNPTIPALRADQLKDYLRGRAKEVKLNNASQRAILDILASQAVFQAEDTSE
jgi:hypothetical protein